MNDTQKLIDMNVNNIHSKDCKNCKYYNAIKIECKHFMWNKCVIRDDKGYVIDYLYHEYYGI